MPTEATILGISGAWWLRALFVVAVALFAARMLQLIRLLRRGRAESRLDHLPRRLWTFAREVAGQVRVFREPVIGWAHPLVFWGFCVFSIASLLMLVGGMFPGLGVPQAEEIPLLGTVVDVFAVLVLLGLVAAAVRRYFMEVPGLQRTRDASLVLGWIAALMLTFLLTEAAGEARSTPLPAGDALRALLLASGVAPRALAAVADVAWWGHVLLLLAFLVYLPRSKHMHLIWVMPSVLFAEQPHRGRLPPSAQGATEGSADPLAGYTWRMLLNALSCAECGRCERACPAAASGSKLSPRALIHDFKEFVLAGGGAGPAKAGGNAAAAAAPIGADVLWGCTTCYACVEGCPVRNEHVPLIVEMRRKLLEAGEVEPALQEALTSLGRYGNSLGKSAKKRFEWAKGLEKPLIDAQKEAVDLLFYVGDYAAYHPDAARVTRGVAELFQRAGLSFGALVRSEKSTGNDARRAGEEGLFELLAEQNGKALASARYERIVTTDPHTYHALKHEYGRSGVDRPVLHYSELLLGAVLSGALRPKRRPEGRAVYHDPCYLGRINGVFEPPRRLIDALGVERVELPRNRENSFCCGAGGGKIWMGEEAGVSERPAVLRMREALDVRDANLFVVACPKDLGMFRDAVKTLGAEQRMRVVDLAELLSEATEEREETAQPGGGV